MNPATDVANVRTPHAAHLVLPRHYAGLKHLSCWVQRTASAHCLSARCAFRLELALVETVTNIIEHGGDDDDTMIEVQIVREAAYVTAQVEDGGLPFDPTAGPTHRRPANLEEAPIGGLGVHLIRAYAQAVEYRRIDQKNQLRLTFPCDV